MVSRIGSAPDVGDTVEVARPRLSQIAVAFFVAFFLATGYESGIIFPPRPTAQTIVIERGMTA